MAEPHVPYQRVQMTFAHVNAVIEGTRYRFTIEGGLHNVNRFRVVHAEFAPLGASAFLYLCEPLLASHAQTPHPNGAVQDQITTLLPEIPPFATVYRTPNYLETWFSCMIPFVQTFYFEFADDTGAAAACTDFVIVLEFEVLPKHF